MMTMNQDIHKLFDNEGLALIRCPKCIGVTSQKIKTPLIHTPTTCLCGFKFLTILEKNIDDKWIWKTMIKYRNRNNNIGYRQYWL